MSRKKIVDYERQERLIEEKRNIFLAKKAGLVHPVPTLTTTIVSEDNYKPKQQTESSEKFPFANDGSFFAQFLQMKPPPSPEPPAPPVPPTHPSPPHHQHNITSINTSPTVTPQPPPPLPPAPPTDTMLPPPPPVKLSLAPLTQPDQPLKAPVSKIFTEENHRSNHSKREDKVSEFELAERMARQLALATEQAVKKFQNEQDREGPLYFLRDLTHPANMYFIQKWLEYRHTDKNKPSNEHITPLVSADSTPRRKTRWSDENDTVKVPPPILYPFNKINPSESIDQKQQIEVQMVLDRIAETIRAGRGRGRGKGVKRFTGTRYEYDSDEENDFGTWEHKRRALEMERTRESADALTELAKGKHHLSDFLPNDEYLKFMTEVEQARQGEEMKPETSDYQDNEIKEDNIGYRMLQRAGWQEGQGLGAQQQGIIAPVNKGRNSLDTTGVGSDTFQNVRSDDDEFSLYRKRMMLAYKFRPNPLNNPRRPYYD